jgi:Mg-chelatase subunit ChlD
MKPLIPLLAALCCAAPALAQGQNTSKPRMEIAFVLDTTGSMGGLIDGAKKKIWSIVNQIVLAKPQPEIRIGFVAYRDKGDAYVTQVHDLSADLDGAFATLSKFDANGGGDTPEHVNAGLHDGVSKLSWSRAGSSNKIYQVIFLVGDCPPHMDYNDGLSYKTDCEAAAKRGILVNAIRCGDNADTEKVWLDIAKRGMGSYLSLPQDGGTISIPTPYDAPMSKLSDELEDTTIAYRGKEARQSASFASNRDAAPASKAERGAFNAKSAQIYNDFDVTTAVANGRKADSFKQSELPEKLAKMPLKERVAYLEKQAERRKQVQTQMAVLEKKRASYIKTELAKRGGSKSGFDQQMLQTFRKQAITRGFKY